MILSNECIRQKLRLVYDKENRIEKHNIKFPSSIEVSVFDDNKNVILKLLKVKKNGVLSNMQTDESAFESWCLILKKWLYKDYHFVLDWTKPNDSSDRHYQRFLYRIFKFGDLFPDWFTFCRDKLDDSLISSISNKRQNNDSYIINVASEKRNNSPLIKDMAGEKNVERRFVSCKKYSLAKHTDLNQNKIDRQLPVGLFRGKVSKDDEYAIFPRSAGQIDIWGIGNDNKTLNIIELKIVGNDKVGIISELFFYTMFLHDVIQGNFHFDKCCKSYLDPEQEIVGKVERIKSYMLAPLLHPLITKEVIDILNNALKGKNIELNYLKYDSNTLECSLPWAKNI